MGTERDIMLASHQQAGAAHIDRGSDPDELIRPVQRAVTSNELDRVAGPKSPLVSSS
jgi:hypothetical protein